MRIAIGLALAMTCLGGAARAQGCQTLSMQASNVHVETIKLYDREGKLQGRIEKKALGATFQVSDCGDPVWVMLPYENKGYLVRKTELTTPQMSDVCICPVANPKPGAMYAVPGGGDLKVCKHPEIQCRP